MSESDEESVEYDEKQDIVLDNGSGFIKAGWAGDDAPRLVEPTILARPIQSTSNDTASFELKYPIKRGIIQDWDCMETIWYTILDELVTNPEDHGVLLTVPLISPQKNRKKIMEIMFETFSVTALRIEVGGLLSVYASGRNTAVPYESGDNITYTMNVTDGYTLNHSHNKLQFGGRDVTDYLAKLLEQKGYSFNTSVERQIVTQIKEKFCQILPNDDDINLAKKVDEKNFKLPDGKIIKIGFERYQCVETLFNPSLIGLTGKGIHEMIYDTIMKCDIDTRRHFFANILLVGGNTMVPGLSKRLKKEIQTLCNDNTRVEILSPPERKYSDWIGGSILASLSTFYKGSITQDSYDEFGSDIPFYPDLNCL